ncbi:MAG: YchJ family metal-binding protein [Pseudomonadota bacterium]
MKNKKPLPEKCACDSGKTFETCCGPYLQNLNIAPTAEALMRSRYTAYTRYDVDYLLLTWHASTRPQTIEFEENNTPKWFRLEVVKHYQDAMVFDKATVEFIAAYKINGRAYRLHETSSFYRERGQWYYVEGVVH